MALQPTKRQKRPIVLSSDSEDGLVTSAQCLSETFNRSNSQLKSKRNNGDISTSQPLAKRSRPKTRSSTSKSRPFAFSQSTSSTLTGNLARGKSKAQKKEETESLRPFFGIADIKRHQVISRNIPIDQAEYDHIEGEKEDVIEDDIPELGFPRHTSLRSTTKFVLDRRKKHAASTPRVPDPTSSEKHQDSSQVFAVPEKRFSDKPSPNAANSLNHEDLKPWAEKYGPTGLDELTVHKKKVADVRKWMEEFWQDGNRKKLLVLKGPAGAGKTATIMALAKSLDVDIIEWKNPKDSHFSPDEYISMAGQFEDFLQRSGKFGSLDFGDVVPGGTLESTTEESTSKLTKNKIILVEEFPHTFSSTSSAATPFRTSLLHYLAANSPSTSLARNARLDGNRTPVVMIITESQLNLGTSNDSVFSAHRLLGPDILGHPYVSVIEFNNMAPTFVVKALELVVKKEARQSGRRRTPGLPLLQKLSEVGDVRSAISALEFLCLRNNDEDEWSGTVARKSKSTNNTAALTKFETDSLEKITQREASLGLFHAVGKVVYNKREAVTNTNSQPIQPPDHLSQYVRPRVSLVSPDELIDSTGTDRQTFVAALHENYVPSCEGGSFLDSLNGCLDALSDTDILGPERHGRGGFGSLGGQGRGASDSLRQDEIGFHLAVRGLLFALPCPVKRSTPPVRNGSKADAFKMFYPTSLRLWKQIEEVESMVDRWAERDKAGIILPKRLPDSSQSMPPAIQTNGKFSRSFRSDDPNLGSPDAFPASHFKNASRLELILETLPYLTMIERTKTTTSIDLQNLEKITELHGLDDKLSDELRANEEAWSGLDPDANILTAARGSSSKPNSKRLLESAAAAAAAAPAQHEAMETEINPTKLWLSDDDIEDD